MHFPLGVQSKQQGLGELQHNGNIHTLVKTVDSTQALADPQSLYGHIFR